MLQISNREDFTNKLAFLMTSQHALSLAGIPQSAESLQATTTEFLDQFEQVDGFEEEKQPEPAPVTQIKALAGYVLKDIRHDRVATLFNRSLFRSEEQAKVDLVKYINESHHYLYAIVPVYL